jgi:hypothetical protein
MRSIQFLSSGAGRQVRFLAGVALILAGALAGGWWLTLMVVGVVPVTAASSNVCLIAPAFHRPLKGSR